MKRALAAVCLVFLGCGGPEAAATPPQECCSGTPGPKGDKGEVGDAGPPGPQGLRGEAGPQGAQGPQGLKGDQGPAGEPGAAGPVGPAGLTGPVGPMGPVGAQGVKGDPGAQGPAGPKGDQGPAGPKGDQGPEGPQGPKGTQGAQGPQGLMGPQGQIGPAGTPRNRNDVYRVDFKTTVPVGTPGQVEARAACYGKNDILLHGGCYGSLNDNGCGIANEQGKLCLIRSDSVAAPDGIAGSLPYWRCDYRNASGVPVDVYAWATCLEAD